MKVWVVTYEYHPDDGGGEDVKAVCATREIAERNWPGDYEIEEFELEEAYRK